MTTIKGKRKQVCFTANEITQNLVIPLWNDKALDVVDNFLSPTADVRTTFLNGTGPESLKQSVKDTFVAFPNFEIKIEDVVQQENKMMYKWHAQAKHEGTILGVPGTGVETQFSGVVFGEVENDKISVYHSFSNIPQVLKTLYQTHHSNSQSHLELTTEQNIPQSDISFELRKITEIPLTKREIECLTHWVRGCSIKESAKQMGGLSERTVQTYRENIKQKFRARNFQALLSIIQQSGTLPIILGNNITK